MKKTTKAISFALSAAIAMSSFAAMSITAGAAENPINIDGNLPFDAVRITYKNGTAPSGATLGVDGKDYPLTAGEESQVVNVPEDTTVPSMTLTDYDKDNVEITLLEYERIEMTSKADTDGVDPPFANPYLAASWHFATGDQKNSGNCTDGKGWRWRDEIKTATRYTHLFDATYENGTLTNLNSGNALGYDGYNEVRMNFNFLKETELAKIRVYHSKTVAEMNDWVIGIPEKKMIGKKYNNEETYDSIDMSKNHVTMTPDYIQKSPSESLPCDNNGTATVHVVDFPLNITTDVLQISLNHTSGSDSNQNYVRELEFYTYKDVYTVGEAVYEIPLTNAPAAFNAVRLTYNDPQTFTGTSQFIAADGSNVGEPQPINFNNTTTGAAVLDTDTVATKTAAKVRITVPDGVPEPTVGEYLKYERIPLLTNAEARAIEGSTNQTIFEQPNMDKGWQIDPTYNSRGSIWENRHAGLFDGTFNETTGVIENLSKSNQLLYFNDYKRTVLNFDFINPKEIAKSTIIMLKNNNISGYKIGIPSYNETAKGYTDLNNPITGRILSEVQSSPYKTFAKENNGSETAYELNDAINTTAQRIQISFDEPKNSTNASVSLAEIAFYTYAEIKDPIAVNVEGGVLNINAENVKEIDRATGEEITDSTFTAPEGSTPALTVWMKNSDNTVKITGYTVKVSESGTEQEFTPKYKELFTKEGSYYAAQIYGDGIESGKTYTVTTTVQYTLNEQPGTYTYDKDIAL